MKAHTLSDVAVIIGITDMARPELWLHRQIVSGKIRARRIGRQWRMTDDDITAALDAFANIPARKSPASSPEVVSAAIVPPVQPSAASMRRRLGVAQ
jgi:hypothetical protein